MEPAGGGNAIADLSFALQALFLPPHSPTQLQTLQFPYLDTWKLFKECGEGGVGGYSQQAQFTTERQPVLRPTVAFSKTSFLSTDQFKLKVISRS